jgi:hypothetical protein
MKMMAWGIGWPLSLITLPDIVPVLVAAVSSGEDCESASCVDAGASIRAARRTRKNFLRKNISYLMVGL